MTDTLQLVLILLASAVFVVVIFRSLQLPPLLGYLIVGVAIGPNLPGPTFNLEETQHLAEFGVVFLMFSIGLEFSLARLFHMRRLVFGLGGAQVLLTLAMLAGIHTAFGMSWQSATGLAAALAVSSTAIVVRMLTDRLETETTHGREIIGVLLFQDLVIVPFLVIFPALAGDSGNLMGALGWAFAKAAIILTVVLFLGQRLMRWWFTIVASRRSHELFIINVLFITLGLAYITNLAGLSLALGAFIAGMLISETEYRHQVEEDIRPFREVLLGLFFITTGMQLHLDVVAQHPLLVVALFIGPMLVKFGVVAGLSRLLGSSPGTAIRSGLSLAQAGEFGLVLASFGMGIGLFESAIGQAAIAGMVLSMLAAPFLIQQSDRIALRFSRTEWMRRSLQLHQVAVTSLDTDQHVIICGYGRTGQNLARFLDREGIKYVALDLDPERIQAAALAGENVVYGDAAHRETLMAAGLGRARALVVSFINTPASLKIIHHAQALNPGVPVIVRTRDDAPFDKLAEAGAAEIVPDAFESSLMLASHAMLMAGVPARRVLSRLREVRGERYHMLRGFFRGTSDDAADIDDGNQPRMRSVTLHGKAYAVGKTIDELGITERGVAVTAVRRRNIRAEDPGPETRFRQGDVVVLLGAPEAVGVAEKRLLKG